MTALQEILTYSNQDVIDRYMEDYEASLEEAQYVFNETLKWLYLCHKAKNRKVPQSILMLDPYIKIDYMWHTFILFTKEYTAFCQQYFGHYLHHQPTTKAEKERFSALSEDEQLAEITATFDAIQDELDSETLLDWTEREKLC